jgi:hypothetical protein
MVLKSSSSERVGVVLIAVKIPLLALVVLLSNVIPGTHPRLRHLGNGGVVMMSQAQKHLWIGAVNYWVYVIFAQLCAMF